MCYTAHFCTLQSEEPHVVRDEGGLKLSAGEFFWGGALKLVTARFSGHVKKKKLEYLKIN